MFSRVLYIGFGGSGPQYDWLTLNLIDELRKEGVQVNQFLVYRHQNSSEIAKTLRAEIQSFKPDMILSALDDDMAVGDLLHEIVRSDCAKVLICFDNLSVPYKHKKSAKAYDLVWLTSYENRHLFDRWGARTLVQPYAANPHLYKPTFGKEYNFSVCFIGTLYGSRRHKLEAISASGASVRVYGKSETPPTPLRGSLNNLSEKLETAIKLSTFPIGRVALFAALKRSFIREKFCSSTKIQFSDEEITFEKMASLYSRNKISINICELWNTYLLKNPVYKLHLRTFEIPMSGGVQLAPRVKELESYFEDKDEILLYDNEEEMIDLIRYYSDDRRLDKREKIRHNARRRCAAEHTWVQRINRVYQTL